MLNTKKQIDFRYDLIRTLFNFVLFSTFFMAYLYSIIFFLCNVYLFCNDDNKGDNVEDRDYEDVRLDDNRCL